MGGVALFLIYEIADDGGIGYIYGHCYVDNTRLSGSREWI